MLTSKQINAGEIATKKEVKVNTIIKRFSDIKKRYDIKIQTTAVGYSAAKKPAAAGAAPGKITKRASGGSKGKASSARKAAVKKAMAGEDWYSSDEGAAQGNLLDSLSDAEPWNSSFGVGGRS